MIVFPKGPVGLPFKGSNEQHRRIITAIRKEILRRHWTIEEQRYGFNDGGEDVVGYFTFTADSSGVVPCLGYEFSTVKRKAFRLMVGLQVGSVARYISSEIVINQRHTGDVPFASQLKGAFDRYCIRFPKTVQEIELLQQAEISLTRVMFQVGRMNSAARNPIATWSQIGKIDQYYRSHDDRTAWGLLTAFAYANQFASPMTQMDKLLRFKKLVMKEITKKELTAA